MKRHLIYFLIAITGLFASCSNDDAPALSFEEQLASDIEEIDAFLDDNRIQAGAHSSGIRYVETAVGEGISPSLTDSVTVKYKGTFFNGEVFDQNTTGVTFLLGGLIESWRIMLPTMKEGGTLTMYAPSGYCYGTRGTFGIAPNTNLIFEMELLEVIEN